MTPTNAVHACGSPLSSIPRVRATLAAGMLALIHAVGCVNVDRPGVQPPATVMDSGGIRVVVLDQVAAVQGEMAVEATTDRNALFRVADARILDDTLVVVADAGANELVLLSRGLVVRRMGRPGAGPGEFTRLTATGFSEDGRILGFDAGASVLWEFLVDGSLAGERRVGRLTGFADVKFLAGHARQPFGVLIISRMYLATGIGRDSVPLVRYSVDWRSADTLGIWAGREWAFAADPEGVARTHIVNGPDVVVASGGGQVAIGSTQIIDVSVFDLDGTLRMLIRGGSPPRPFTRSELARIRAQEEQRLASAPPALTRLVLENLRTAPPALHGLGVDRCGGVWIGTSETDRRGRRTWVAVRPDGTVSDIVGLPQNARVLDISERQVLLLDELPTGEQVVTTMRSNDRLCDERPI